MINIKIPIEVSSGIELTLVITYYWYTPGRGGCSYEHPPDPPDVEVKECHLESYRGWRLDMDPDPYLEAIEDAVWDAVEKDYEGNEAEHEAGLADFQYECQRDEMGDWHGRNE